MADSASLVATLGVNLAQFKAGMKQASDEAQKGVKTIEEKFNKTNPQLSTFTRNAETIGRRIGTLIGIGLAAGIAAEIASIRSLDELGKKVQDYRLSASQISGLNFAGAGAGVSADEVDKALSSFTEVSKKAKADAEEFYKALSNIGPGFATAFENAPTQAARLEVVRQAFASTTDEVKKAQLAQEAFGTDSERVIALFGNGAAGLNNYAEAAREAGIQIDDALVQKAAEAQRKLDALTQVISAELKVALQQLIPVIQKVALELPALFDAASAVLTKFGGLKYATDNVIGSRLAAAQAELSDFNKAISENAPEIQKTYTVGRGAKRQFVDPKVLEKRAAVVQELIELETEQASRGGLPDVRDLRNAASARFKALNSTAGAAAFKPRASLKAPSGGGGGGASESLDAYERQIQQVEKLTARLYAEATAVGQSDVAVQKAKVTADLYSAAKKAGVEITDQVKQKILEEANAYAQAAQTLADARARQEEFNQISAGFGSALNQAFDGLVIRGEKLKDVIKNLASQLASMASQKAFSALFNVGSGGGSSIFGGLLSSLFGGGGGGVSLGGLYHSGGIVGQGTVGRSVSASAWAGAPRFHSGLMTDEVAAILKKGEVVLTPGQVRGMGAAMSSGGGINVVMQNTFTGGVTATDIARMLPELKQQAIAGVAEAVRRGTI